MLSGAWEKEPCFRLRELAGKGTDHKGRVLEKMTLQGCKSFRVQALGFASFTQEQEEDEVVS